MYTYTNPLFEKLCEYLVNLGLLSLHDTEYAEILKHIRFGHQFDAIQALCDYTRNTYSVHLNLPMGNGFATWLCNQGKGSYEDTKSLGLKEARDIVDFLIANPEQAGL